MQHIDDQEQLFYEHQRTLAMCVTNEQCGGTALISGGTLWEVTHAQSRPAVQSSEL